MRLALMAVCMFPAWAHVVSMSTGEAKLNGVRLDYELRMPLYEAAHIDAPETRLFESIRFRAGGRDARLMEHACRPDEANLVCTGLYLFEREVDHFDVECRFASITVPNHVHLLRAVRGDKSEQAAFDGSFTGAAIRFRPPTRWETGARDASAGFWRAIAGVAQWLFLAALVLAAGSRHELVQLTAMFLAGQALTVAAHLAARLEMSPRFIEAATALTVAYLAVEILLLPSASERWLVVGVLGLLHGMYFDLLLGAGGYGAPAFLAGAFLAEAAIVVALAALAGLAAKLPFTRAASRALASLLLLTGISWFLLRLRG